MRPGGNPVLSFHSVISSRGRNLIVTIIIEISQANATPANFPEAPGLRSVKNKTGWFKEKEREYPHVFFHPLAGTMAQKKPPGY